MRTSGLINLTRRLLRSRAGVIAIMFGVIYVPLTTMAFEALVASMSTANQQRIMAALDAALIAVAATPSSKLNQQGIPADQQSILNAFWAANNGPKICGSSTNPVLSFPTTNQLEATVSCTTGAGGVTSPTSAYSSIVTKQGFNIEVAMVLDNTGSMGSAVDSSGNVTNASYTYPTKITALKQAALSFLNILKTTATGSGIVKVGMVPFTTDVNVVNPGDPNESGTQIGNTAATQAQYVYFQPKILEDLISYTSGTTCSDPNNYVMQTPAANSTYFSQVNSGTFSCPHTQRGRNGQTTTTVQNLSESWYTMPSAFDSTHYANWSGCVVDRDEVNNPTADASTVDYSISNTAPPQVAIGTTPTSAQIPKMFPADNIDCGNYAVGPLSIIPLQDIYYNANMQLLADRLLCRPDNDSTCNPTGSSIPSGWTNICSITFSVTVSCNSGTGSVTINGTATNQTGMLANGDTNLTIGLDWGWNMLTQNFPMFPTANQALGGSGSTGVKQFLVFFTDGQNTQNRFSFTQSAIDTETTAICTAIKTAGVTIFTIGTSDADTTILRGCATTGDSYTGLVSTQIQPVFQDIAGQIANLRVTQ